MAVVPGDPANSVYVSIGLDANAGSRPGPVDGPGVTYDANYESLGAWQTARLRDLVAVDQTEVVECYNDWPGGLVNTTIVTGWTNDPTHRIIIRSAYQNEPTNVATDGFYFTSNNSRCFQAVTRNVDLIRVGLFPSAGTSAAYRVLELSAGGAGTNIVDQCIIGSDKNASVELILSGQHEVDIRNCFIYGNNASKAMDIGVYSFVFIHANTIRGVVDGIVGTRTGGTSEVRNNVVFAYTGTPLDLAAGYAVGGNVTEDASAPGQVYQITDPTSEFVDSSGANLHIVEGCGFRGLGEDLSSRFTNDIDGDTRSAWDCGADEYAVTAADEYNAMQMLGIPF